MHKYLRAVGFSDIRRKDLDMILDEVIDHPDSMKMVPTEEGEFSEFSKRFAPGIGINLRGFFDENEHFSDEYYIPVLEGRNITSHEWIEIQKHAEKESYAGICDDVNLGLTLIFYITNAADYIAEKQADKNLDKVKGAVLSGLAAEGKILLPMEQTREAASVKNYEKRTELMAQAREGNQEAMDSLNLQDMNAYNAVSQRVMKEDILSIVSSYFMPYGVESDQYSVLAEIREVERLRNDWTGEYVYRLQLCCNNLIFDVCINEKDLMGEPAIGRRFKGNIWMQGILCL